MTESRTMAPRYNMGSENERKAVERQRVLNVGEGYAALKTKHTISALRHSLVNLRTARG